MGDRGLFVSVEGIDGSGKSTQAARLAERLRLGGHAVTETREPGGSAGAEAIRKILLAGHDWSAVPEMLLFSAARSDHVERVIGPALAAGRVVISDRFADSTRAYQGEEPGVAALLETVHAAAVGIEPDLTLLFDIDPGVAAARRAGRDRPPDRIEDRGAAFQESLRRRFLALAEAAPARIRVIAAGGSADAVAEAVWSVVRPVLPVPESPR